MKGSIAPLLALMAAFCLGGSLFAQPTVGPVLTDPVEFPVNTPTLVRITTTITSPLLIAGSPNAQRLYPDGKVVILGTLRDDGVGADPVAGDKVYSLAVLMNESSPGEIAVRASAAFLGKIRRVFSDTTAIIRVTAAQQYDITVRGIVYTDSGSPVSGATVTGGLGAQGVALRTLTSSSATTGPGGEFSLQVRSGALPVRVVVRVSRASVPPTDTSRWGEATSTLLNLGRILLPDPQGAEMTVAGGVGQSADGSLQALNLPAEVTRLFARTYDPDRTPEAFPGEFAEQGTIPLNSSVFVWAEALGPTGNSLTQLSQPVTFRARIPRSQWPDLEDINSGTDRIEVPIYVFNELIQLWEQESVGWLEDAARTVLPEDAQSVILNGAFPGEIYAVYVTTHLSWMNVDYPYIGPWTLSRISSSYRNSDCLYKAMQLAKRIANSQKGRDAYAKVNKAGADLSVEMADGKGPEMKTEALADAYGVYRGDSGGKEDEVFLDSGIWDGCGPNATENQKKNTIVMMAVTLLHESAHWKDDVKKYAETDPGGGKEYDTPGEEGEQLEKDLFGGSITGGANGVQRDGADVDAATRDGWLNHDNWPPPAPPRGSAVARPAVRAVVAASPLEVTLSVPKTTFALGENLPVTVTYRNIGSSSISILNRTVLEGYPLYFQIVHQTSGVRAPFLGPERKLKLTAADFTSLAPGGTLAVVVNLVRTAAGELQYRLVSGQHRITAVYEAWRGVPETTSNTLTVTIGAGGRFAGRVTDAVSTAGIPGATVRISQGGNLLATATTNGQGDYTSAELPPGNYDLEVQAPGYLRSTRTNVALVAGQTTTVNLSLSMLLVLGEMRIVLTWGASPSDLDSHLWLPLPNPYHIAYFRMGNLAACPFARLDRDDTTSYGPETITVKQRYTTGEYVFAVHQYSSGGTLAASSAQVQVFDSRGLLATYTVPTTGTGRWWNVFRINGATGALTEVNTIGGDPAPYADTAAGCAQPN